MYVPGCFSLDHNFDSLSVYPFDNRPLGLAATAHDSSGASRVPRSEVLSSSHDPSGMGRRLTAPNLNREGTRVLMKVCPFRCLQKRSRHISHSKYEQLHIDYLSAQSTLLRALFSGSSPLDLIHPTAQLAPPQVGSSSRRSSISASVASRLPRLLPSAPDHPVVYLPIPDPSSFPYLVTWMYFGDTSALEDALQRHVIHWDGLARNVEYLGMPEELKRFLGRWYRRWLQSVQQQQPPPGGTKNEDETDDAPRGRPRSREHSTSPH
jgi:hypothetical protein